MREVILIIHLLLAVGLITVILFQRAEGGGLGIGGGGGGGGFMTARSQANLLTRMTAVFATLFIITSLALAIIAARGRPAPASILDQPAPVTAPAAPAAPSVPLAK